MLVGSESHLRSFQFLGHLGVVITQFTKGLPAEEVELCRLDEPVHAVAVQIGLKHTEGAGHVSKLLRRVGLLKEEDGVAAVAARVRFPVGVAADETLFGRKGQVAKEAEAEALGVGFVHRASGVLEHVLVERAVFGARQQETRVVLVPPNDARGHILVLLEGGERNERPAHVPHVDVVVHHHGAGG